MNKNFVSHSMIFSFPRKSVDQFLSVLEHITLDDITNIAQKIISSPLTMASYGDGTVLHFQVALFTYFHCIWIVINL